MVFDYDNAAIVKAREIEMASNGQINIVCEILVKDSVELSDELSNIKDVQSVLVIQYDESA